MPFRILRLFAPIFEKMCLLSSAGNAMTSRVPCEYPLESTWLADLPCRLAKLQIYICTQISPGTVSSISSVFAFSRMQMPMPSLYSRLIPSLKSLLDHRFRVAAGQGQGPRVRAGMSLEGRVRAQMSGPQVRAGLSLEARP